MQIIVDCSIGPLGLPDGYHVIDTANSEAMQTLAAIESDKSTMKAAGFAELSKLPGLPDGTRRWDVIVNASKKADADPALVSLNLTA